MCIVVSVMKGVVFFHNFGFFIQSIHTFYWRPHLQFWEMKEAATERSSWFRPPKNFKEEVSLLERSKPEGTQWAVDVFRYRQTARDKKFPLLEPGSVFRDYDVHPVQSLEEMLEDLDSLSLNLNQLNSGIAV